MCTPLRRQGAEEDRLYPVRGFPRHIQRLTAASVCCMYATKEAIIAKEHATALEPTIFFMDIRAYGKDFDRFVRPGQERVRRPLHPLQISRDHEDPQTKNLLITLRRGGGGGPPKRSSTWSSCPSA